jgi:hypothetical protein
VQFSYGSTVASYKFTANQVANTIVQAVADRAAAGALGIRRPTIGLSAVELAVTACDFEGRDSTELFFRGSSKGGCGKKSRSEEGEGKSANHFSWWLQKRMIFVMIVNWTACLRDEHIILVPKARRGPLYR